MVLIYEDNLLVGIADDTAAARKMVEDQFNDCTRRGYFANAGTKGVYKTDIHIWPGIKGNVVEYISSCEDDPTYRLIPFETNAFLPGCEKLPTTYYNP